MQQSSKSSPSKNPPSKTAITYKDAGVSIDAGNKLVAKIKPFTARTKRPEVMGHIGGFGALCELPGHYKQPVLVSGTDGVGTKLKIAIDLNRHNSIGIDLVAMCVNDLIVAGAEPLQFLDYFATAKLDVEVASQVIEGIAEGCVQAGCALVGGETAEMPDMYKEGDYDLAGFCQGVVEKNKIIDGSRVSIGDQLIGLPSSGLHSNGYSLVRKVVEQSGVDINQFKLGAQTLADILLEPTRIYVKPLLQLFREIEPTALAHITGGGLLENIPRVLPAGTKAVIDDSKWQRAPIFDWLAEQGNIPTEELYRTFNCGIGMVIVVNKKEAQNAMDMLKIAGQTPVLIGEIAAAKKSCNQVEVGGL